MEVVRVVHVHAEGQVMLDGAEGVGFMGNEVRHVEIRRVIIEVDDVLLPAVNSAERSRHICRT
eukprot:4056142-Pleurochrysis_carterae.AAC.1